MEYHARNYAQLAPQVYQDLALYGKPSPSRNGDVLRLPGTHTFVVDHPWERVNFSPVRDANPFFHLIEAMAMLANYNSVALLSYLAKNMALYSDDGDRYNAFYGTRMRSNFGFDQLSAAIAELRRSPASRQCVVQIWDPADVNRTTKDKACNLCLIFDVVDGKVNMASFNRSNDAIWGIITGANVVHLSFFHEYVARALVRPMGSWSHTTANLHVYTDNPLWEALTKAAPGQNDLYGTPEVPFAGGFEQGEGSREAFDTGMPLVLRMMEECAATKSSHLQDLIPWFFSKPEDWTRLPDFVRGTVMPVFNAWHLRKIGRHGEVLPMIEDIQAPDWRVACRNWVLRRTKQ